MKTILDEGVPHALAESLDGHEVSTVQSEGWRGIKNGKLLDLIEDSGFDALITNDKRIEREQQIERRSFAILVLSVSNWDIISGRIPDIQSALDQSRPGTLMRVECGMFIAKRFRGNDGR